MATTPTVAGRTVSGTGSRWSGYDILLITATALLILFGLMAQFSKDRAAGTSYFPSQAFRIALGIGPFLVFLLTPLKWLSRYVNAIYILNVVLLIMVLAIGREGGGAQRWIRLGPLELQPSEVAKLFTTITLAAYFSARMHAIDKLSTFLVSLAHMSLPMALIFIQPHLGATLSLIVIWLGISICAGVPVKYIVAVIAVAGGLFTTAIFVPGILSEYQRGRVLAMFNPDEKGNKYQSMKARVAIGSGGVFGTGYLKGEHKEKDFVPEQQTDYVLTIPAEEGGLFGCSLLLLAFGFFFYRVWLVMFQASEPFMRMIAAGIFSFLAFHMAVNMGMVLEILPVVGLWLPFLSFGGSAIWLCMSSVGLLLNVRKHETAKSF